MGEAALRQAAVEMPRRVFGATLRRHKMPERIAGGNWDGAAWRGHPAIGPDRGHLPNDAHQDVRPYGDLKPDYFMMLR